MTVGDDPPAEPRRVRLSRRAGYRKPAGAVVVTRPGRWGNRWPPGSTGEVVLPGGSIEPGPHEPLSRAQSIASVRHAVEARLVDDPGYLDPLRGRDLACWCALDEPCHADVYLDLANRHRGPDVATSG